MSSAPAISVLLPVHNAEGYLRAALDSLVNQTFTDWECLAVDDGSSDASGKILDEYANRDSRFRVIHQPPSGIVAALNRGLCEAKADLIARMDADDVAYPQRFQKQKEFLDQHPEILGCGAWVRFVDPQGAPIWTYRVSGDPDHIRRDLLNGGIGGLIHPVVMLRKTAIDRAGPYRKEYEYIEDFDLFLRLTDIGPMTNLQETLLDYRQHWKSVNRVADRRDRTRRKVQLLASRGVNYAPSPSEYFLPSRAETYYKWAQWALGDRHLPTARHYALLAWKEHPLGGREFCLWLRTIYASFKAMIGK